MLNPDRIEAAAETAYTAHHSEGPNPWRCWGGPRDLGAPVPYWGELKGEAGEQVKKKWRAAVAAVLPLVPVTMNPDQELAVVEAALEAVETKPITLSDPELAFMLGVRDALRTRHHALEKFQDDRAAAAIEEARAKKAEKETAKEGPPLGVGP